jgi:sulfur carrier protein ThiS
VRLEVRAFATLAAFLPPGTRAGAILEVPDGVTIIDLVHALGIPDDMPLVALVNGHEVETSHSLQGDDVVTLFPPLAGG